MCRNNGQYSENLLNIIKMWCHVKLCVTSLEIEFHEPPSSVNLAPDFIFALCIHVQVELI